MTVVLVDTSVLIKWFHHSGETELVESATLRSAHLAGDVDAHIIDLAIYEVGNVLLRALGWKPNDVADQLDDLISICGAPWGMTPQWTHRAATLAGTHRLSFYDACWAAAADVLRVPLVSADRKLVGTGLSESPSDIVRRLRLRP